MVTSTTTVTHQGPSRTVHCVHVVVITAKVHSAIGTDRRVRFNGTPSGEGPRDSNRPGRTRIGRLACASLVVPPLRPGGERGGTCGGRGAYGGGGWYGNPATWNQRAVLGVQETLQCSLWRWRVIGSREQGKDHQVRVTASLACASLAHVRGVAGPTLHSTDAHSLVLE